MSHARRHTEVEFVERRRAKPVSSAWMGFAAAAALANAAHASADLINLGAQFDLEWSQSYAVSSNGLVVTGRLSHSNGQINTAFRWSATDGMQLLGEGEGSIAYGVSGDGTVVVGETPNFLKWPTDGIRWTSEFGVEGIFPGGVAHAVSRDGLVVVGRGQWGAARWTATGGTEYLSSAGLASARAVNGDGTVVVGQRYITAYTVERAVRWTEEGTQELDTLGGTNSRAYGISDDGMRIVGDANVAGDAQFHAVLWATNGLQDLGTLGGLSATAYAISGDGLSVVGTSNLAAGGRQSAFLWTDTIGMVDLNTYLPTLGINLTGWTLSEARGISFDGSVITGTGTFNGQAQAFVVTGIPAPGTAALLGFGGLVAARRRR